MGWILFGVFFTGILVGRYSVQVGPCFECSKISWLHSFPGRCRCCTEDMIRRLSPSAIGVGSLRDKP